MLIALGHGDAERRDRPVPATNAQVGGEQGSTHFSLLTSEEHARVVSAAVIDMLAAAEASGR